MGMPMTTAFGGKALDSISTTANRPALLSNIYDRRMEREKMDLERRKVESEAQYKDSLRAKEAQAAQEALRAEGIIAAMPQIDLNGSDKDIVKQMRAQYMYLSNNGMTEDAKRIMSETKNAIASGGQGTGTQAEITAMTGAYKSEMQGNLASANARYVDMLKAPAPPAPQGPDLVALDQWVNEQGEDPTWKNLWGLMGENMYSDRMDILYAQARNKMDQMATTSPISIIDAAELVKQEWESLSTAPGGPPQVPGAGIDMSPQPPGLPQGWSIPD